MEKRCLCLATDVARLTGYRDSYIFFVRNRQLRKVVTTRAERDDLVRRGAIPFSHRYRHISVVTARSVFIQFGHRVIINGQRIRDDYYENRAVLQDELLLSITKIQSKATMTITDRENQNPGMSITLQPCRRKSSRKQPTMETNPPLPNRFPKSLSRNQYPAIRLLNHHLLSKQLFAISSRVFIPFHIKHTCHQKLAYPFKHLFLRL